MPVVSTSYAVDAHTQADGRRYVTETYVLSVGDPVRRTYLAPAGADYQAIMLARVLLLNAALAEREARANVNSDNAPAFIEQTAAQFLSAFWNVLWDAYVSGQKFLYHRLVWRGWKWINDGHVTNAQMRDSFNAWRVANGKPTLTNAEWNTLVTNRLVPIKDRYLATLAEGKL